MKQIDIQISARNRNQHCVSDASALDFQLFSSTKSNEFLNSITTFAKSQEQIRDFNTFPNQNLGKGPPGRSRSPGVGDGLFPDHPPDAKKEVMPNLFRHPIEQNDIPPIPVNRDGLTNSTFENTIHTEHQIFNNTQKLNFYLQLNFTIMKKQILIIVFFILAILAGTKSYAQDKDYVEGASAACATVVALPCATDSHLNPIPGKTYNYSVTVNPGVTTGNVQWFVYNATTTGAIITGGSMATAFAAAEADGGTSQFLLDAEDAKYKSLTNISGSIDVSWQSFDGATNRILLVAYVKGEGGCSDNIEVFRIEPIFAFTLDIAGLMPNGTVPASGNALECLTPVQSATYNGTNLTMDYGDNYVFFTVTAANFVHSWQPTFTLTNNTQSTVAAATDITWAYPTEAIKTTGGVWNAVTAPVLAQGGGSVGAAGQCIIVRVHIDHNNVGENDAAAARNIILGVDGKMYNVAAANYTTAGLQDLDPSAVAPCTNTVTDQAQYDLTPRPQITENTPVAPAFEPKN